MRRLNFLSEEFFSYPKPTQSFRHGSLVINSKRATKRRVQVNEPLGK